MLVFWKERLVFLAVPKTGTTAYARALANRASLVVTDPPELKHAPLYRYNRFFRPLFDKLGEPRMDLLAVIREPVDWLGSWWRFRQRDFLTGEPVSTRGISFDTFCEAYASAAPPPFAQVGSQARFVAPRPNGISVTHLYRYENQDALLAFLEARLGGPITLPRRNVSPKADLDLSPQTEARLRAQCAADFEIWERAL